MSSFKRRMPQAQILHLGYRGTKLLGRPNSAAPRRHRSDHSRPCPARRRSWSTTVRAGGRSSTDGRGAATTSRRSGAERRPRRADYRVAGPPRRLPGDRCRQSRHSVIGRRRRQCSPAFQNSCTGTPQRPGLRLGASCTATTGDSVARTETGVTIWLDGKSHSLAAGDSPAPCEPGRGRRSTHAGSRPRAPAAPVRRADHEEQAALCSVR